MYGSVGHLKIKSGRLNDIKRVIQELEMSLACQRSLKLARMAARLLIVGRLCRLIEAHTIPTPIDIHLTFDKCREGFVQGVSHD